MKSSTWSDRLILAAAAVFIAAGPVAAASFKVSTNGIDSPTCGSGPNPPCATIAQAVANAADGDSILVGAGSYAGATVNKALKLWSANGLGGAIITSQMTLSSDGISFGKRGKGFSLGPGSSTAIAVTGNGVTVRGNLLSNCTTGVDVSGNDAVVRDNSFNGCGTSINISGSGAQVRGNRIGSILNYGVLLGSTSSAAVVRDNRMFGPTGVGVGVDGSGHLLRRNLIQGTPAGGFLSMGPATAVELLENVVVGSTGPAYNLSTGSDWVLTGNAALNNAAPGFYLTAPTTFTLTDNVAIANVVYGILIANGSGQLEGNTAIDNNGDGITLGSITSPAVVSGGNVYGNTSGCGINNGSGSAVTADKVYWGAASGPGADPADMVCGNTAAVSVTRPAPKAAKIKLPPVK